MSGDSEPEIKNANEHEGNAPNAPQGSTPEAGPNSAVAHSRQGFFTESRHELLRALGEEPQENKWPYQCFREGQARGTPEKGC
jgi:hypothetical protein